MHANITIPALITMVIYAAFMGGTGLGIYFFKHQLSYKLTIEAVTTLMIMLLEMLVICIWNR
jgi:hypothetical protein